MCGINGFNFVDQLKIERMNERTKHRGPDDGGFLITEKWSFGHNRLSIIDLSPLGHQPMITPDEKFAIVFNGEIYNYQELKQELTAKGYQFKSKSDTEVLLYAFQEWGTEIFPRLNGIFACAIINLETEQVWVARDHMGVKPLYYYYKDGIFIFSSEVKAILEHQVDTSLSTDALNIYFRFLYVPAPLTLWQNIYKLPAAHYATIKDGYMSIEKYWQIKETPVIEDKPMLEREIQRLLKDSVQKQLVADRPVGIFLSGGIDSTIIAGLASETSPHINTFSVGFEDTEETEKYNNDARIAKQTAAHFGTTHHEFILTAEDIKNNLEKTIYHMDEPISNHVQTVNMLLAKHTSKIATVVLGGDGGDELFGGYERYYYSSLIDRYQKLPPALRKSKLTELLLKVSGKKDIVSKLNCPRGLERYFSFFSQKEEHIKKFLLPQYNDPQTAREYFGEKFFSHVPSKDFTREFMRVDLQTWLPDESLARSDKMTMAAGLEERVPFLDYRLVELADRIPVEYKLGGKGLNMLRSGHSYRGKKILTSAMKGYIPEFVLKQPKWGWFSPAAKWIRGPLLPLMKEVLSPEYNKGTADMFDFASLQTMLDDHVTKKQYNLNTLWAVMTFQLWYRQFMGK